MARCHHRPVVSPCLRNEAHCSAERCIYESCRVFGNQMLLRKTVRLIGFDPGQRDRLLACSYPHPLVVAQAMALFDATHVGSSSFDATDTGSMAGNLAWGCPKLPILAAASASRLRTAPANEAATPRHAKRQRRSLHAGRQPGKHAVAAADAAAAPPSDAPADEVCICCLLLSFRPC